MKKDTEIDYQERVNRVLDYVQNHLDEKLELDKLSQISNFSPYHFHRIMRAFLGEPLGAYLTRVRLDHAARLIKFSDAPLQDIAWKIGYDSQASFTKAFRKRFEMAPSTFREKNVDLDKFIVFAPQEQEEYLLLKPKIKQLKSKSIITVLSIGEYGSSGTRKAWETIFAFAKKHRLFSWKMEMLGMSFDDPNVTESAHLRYYACLVVKKEVKPEGEVNYQSIPEGKFAIFSFKGPYSNLGVAYNTILRSWLPESGYQLREEPVFERYLNNAEKTKPEKLKTDIYIPIF